MGTAGTLWQIRADCSKSPQPQDAHRRGTDERDEPSARQPRARRGPDRAATHHRVLEMEEPPGALQRRCHATRSPGREKPVPDYRVNFCVLRCVLSCRRECAMKKWIISGVFAFGLIGAAAAQADRKSVV